MNWTSIDLQEPEKGEYIEVDTGLDMSAFATYAGDKRINYPLSGPVNLDWKTFIIEKWRPAEK